MAVIELHQRDVFGVTAFVRPDHIHTQKTWELLHVAVDAPGPGFVFIGLVRLNAIGKHCRNRFIA